MDQVEEQNLIRRRMQHGMITIGVGGATSTTGSTPVSLDEDVTLPLAAVLIGVALCSAVLVYFLRIISTISSKRPPRHANMKVRRVVYFCACKGRFAFFICLLTILRLYLDSGKKIRI